MSVELRSRPRQIIAWLVRRLCSHDCVNHESELTGTVLLSRCLKTTTSSSSAFHSSVVQVARMMWTRGPSPITDWYTSSPSERSMRSFSFSSSSIAYPWRFVKRFSDEFLLVLQDGFAGPGGPHPRRQGRLQGWKAHGQAQGMSTIREAIDPRGATLAWHKVSG